MSDFDPKLARLQNSYRELAERKNEVDDSWYNGLYERYRYPILTRNHVPLSWRYDLNEKANPYLMERLGVNAVFNPGAIEIDGVIYLVVRIEGYDRKSFFAIAESKTGIDNFTFWDSPILLSETDDPDTNVYDMRLVKHEDGWIYGLFCTERKDPTVPHGNTVLSIANGGVARTKDMKTWERLPDIKTDSPQQRNVVLHPEFVDGKYAFYTRPQDDFFDPGKGGGIGFALADNMESVVIQKQEIIDPRQFHTVKEYKNGQGPAPIKTKKGWLHIAHAVRENAAGYRYVLYAFLSDLQQPQKVICRPGGHLMAPLGAERVGDVSDVLFCNGMVARESGEMFIYYASSDTRIHVATTTMDKMLDYVENTPPDPLRTYACVVQRNELIHKNTKITSGDVR